MKCGQVVFGQVRCGRFDLYCEHLTPLRGGIVFKSSALFKLFFSISCEVGLLVKACVALQISHVEISQR